MAKVKTLKSKKNSVSCTASRKRKDTRITDDNYDRIGNAIEYGLATDYFNY